MNVQFEEKPKTLDRLSKLFQKKAKRSLTPSLSSLTKQSIKSLSSPDRISFIEEPCNDSMRINQVLQQQRTLLRELELQKQMLSSDVNKLGEQLRKVQEKTQQKCLDLDILEQNYQHHLRSMRCTNDDPHSIALKVQAVQQKIHALATELLPFAEQVTSEKLSELWVNLGTAMEKLGKHPFKPSRIQMLTEKFMMDVVVQNLNIHLFPGLSCNTEYLQVQAWFDSHQHHLFSTRLRQELALIVKPNDSWNKCADKTWYHLFKGLQKAYPTFLAKKPASDPKQALIAQVYAKKLRELVDDTISLGSAIKGQEVIITAVDVREGTQLMDTRLMVDEDGQKAGTIGFCISPPFVMKVAERYEPLVKGRVLCFP